MLPGKWNSNDSYCHQNPENDMNDGDIKTTQQDPDNIEKQIQATISGSLKIKGLPKWRQWKNAQFNELDPERYSDDGQTDYQPSHQIKKTNEYTPAEYHPQKISNGPHKRIIGI